MNKMNTASAVFMCQNQNTVSGHKYSIKVRIPIEFPVPKHSLYVQITHYMLSYYHCILLSYGIEIYISRFDFLLDPFCIFFYTCFVLIIVL